MTDLQLFEAGKRKILFFSRGRGRGHAIPDIEIANAIGRLRDDVEVRLVSYGTGAQTIRELGLPLVDVGLPDEGSIAAMSVLAGKLIGCLNPDLVIAHEEFSALPAAKIFEKKTICITDWFDKPGDYSAQALLFADRILFAGQAGRFEEPPWVRGKVCYIDPILRQFRYTGANRTLARRELGFPEDATVIAVLPGSWSERQVPTLDLILGAFDRLAPRSRHLVWVAGGDFDFVREKTGHRQDVRVLSFDPLIDRIMVSADQILTKGTRTTLQEIALLELEAAVLISRKEPANPLDLKYAEGHPCATIVDLGDPECLDVLAAVLAGPSTAGKAKPPRHQANGLDAAVGLILESLLANGEAQPKRPS